MATLQQAPSAGTARFHLHLDGAALFFGALIAYAATGGSWWLFAGLLLAPDVSMLGYLVDARFGALVYNIGHSLVWPLALIGLGLVASAPGAVLTAAGPLLVLRIGVIWAAHLGMDRAFGFGYKYPTRFNDTDIGRA